MFKNLFNKLGLSNIFLQKNGNLLSSNIDIDFRSNYIFNNELESFNDTVNKENNDLILLINTNPRYEASSLNIRLRQLLIKKNIKIASIGNPLNLTYEHKHLGNSIYTLYNLVHGKHL
jgi:NADH dehydrogenase (ubiquinone) Fe-S protein 1